MAGRVEHDLVNGQRNRGPTQQHLRPDEQFADVERLGQVVVGADLEPTHLVSGSPRAVSIRTGASTPCARSARQNVPPAGVGKTDVENHDVRRRIQLSEQLDAGRAGGNRVPVAFQRPAQNSAQRSVIFTNSNLGHHPSTVPTSRNPVWQQATGPPARRYP
ncbi:hypothetical protein GCM10009630_10160 [Kribbella jejuensis]|nr:hypothetical protein [Kribbella jejuensis]